MKHVLAAIDTSPCARPVLDTARSLAELFGVEATALHVGENSSIGPQQHARDAGIELRETAGPPVETIVAAAADPDVIALVLGARGDGGAKPAGHTALEVITNLAKPVVVVPPNATPSVRIGRILVPLEGSEQSSRAIADTIQLAHRPDIDVLLLHVHNPATAPPFQDQPHHEVAAWEREFVARFVQTPRPEVEVLQRVGIAAEHILSAAGDVQADLLALGWSRHLDSGRAQVIRQTLTESATPVLLVPVD